MTTESQDVPPQQIPHPWTRFHAAVRTTLARREQTCWTPSWKLRTLWDAVPPRFRANAGGLLWRLFKLVYIPYGFAPLIVDCWLLMQSAGGRGQLGPDLVYPMLSTRKRQSGPLAKLILEHGRNEQSYQLSAAGTSQPGIDLPCVAVIDLDQMSGGAGVRNTYSTPVDLYGLTCMLITFEMLVMLAVHAYCLLDGNVGWVTWINLGIGISINVYLCLDAVLRGEGTLTLSWRMDPSSTLRHAVLLEQDFTVILRGEDRVVQAISENGFNLSYNQGLLLREPPLGGEEPCQDSLHGGLGALCTGIMGVILSLEFWICGTYMRASGVYWQLSPGASDATLSILDLPDLIFVVFAFLLPLFQTFIPRTWSHPIWQIVKLSWFTSFPVIICLLALNVLPIPPLTAAFCWHFATLFLYVSLFGLFSAGYKAQSYPIRSARFLDAIRHPPVRKWQFETLSAAATFQCLALCHGIPRPIKSIDVLAFLDMLVPDEIDVWTVWKKRVADRIVHEEDISFMPTISTFRDAQQQQLLDLLCEAQFGYDQYKESYAPGAGALPNPTTRDDDPSWPSLALNLFLFLLLFLLYLPVMVLFLSLILPYALSLVILFIPWVIWLCVQTLLRFVLFIATML